MRQWTDKEDEILRRDYPYFGKLTELDRPWQQIRDRASKLGIKSERGHGPTNKVLEGFEEILSVNDPPTRLLLAIVYQAYLDEDEEFFASGGGEWGKFVDLDLTKLMEREDEI